MGARVCSGRRRVQDNGTRPTVDLSRERSRNLSDNSEYMALKEKVHLQQRLARQTSDDSDDPLSSSSSDEPLERPAEERHSRQEVLQVFRRNSEIADGPPLDSSASQSAPKESNRVRRGVDGFGYKWLNEYVFVGAIGKGAYCKVKLGIHSVTGESVAIKVCQKELLSKKKKGSMLNGKTLLEDVNREIAIMKKLQHPAIVRLIEVIDDDEHANLYMVLEFVPGGALLSAEQVGFDPPLSDASARTYFRDVLCGLHYLHGVGIIHRDIKPQNLLRTADGHVKIADFSVSVFFRESRSVDRMAGSPCFLAPETVNDEIGDVSNAVDLWALGVTLWMFVFGRPPFSNPSVYRVYEDIQRAPHVFPDGASPLVMDLLNGLLVKAPSARATIPVVAAHPWTTNGGAEPLSLPAMTQPLEVTDDEVRNAVISFAAMAALKTRMHRLSERARGNLRTIQASGLAQSQDSSLGLGLQAMQPPRGSGRNSLPSSPCKVPASLNDATPMMSSEASTTHVPPVHGLSSAVSLGMLPAARLARNESTGSVCTVGELPMMTSGDVGIYLPGTQPGTARDSLSRSLSPAAAMTATAIAD